MTETEQRVAIAEACGWTSIHWIGGDYVGTNQLYGSPQRVPDYPNDLDSIQEVIMKELESSGASFQATYLLNLQEVVERRRPDLNREQIGWWMIFATAAQHLECFLKSKGLWK